MSGMDGNPHYDDAFASMKGARNAGIPNEDEAHYLLQEAQIEATLTLAFEQRTANMIALAENITARARLDEKQLDGVLDQIIARLGLTERTTP